MKALIVVFAFLLLTGCADSVTFEQAALMTPVGFLHGLWHGMTFGIAWFFSMFVDSISVYAVYNNGGWYDFGFFLGICAVFGGTSTTVVKK
jgi:hypothetical protein